MLPIAVITKFGTQADGMKLLGPQCATSELLGYTGAKSRSIVKRGIRGSFFGVAKSKR